MKRGAVLLSAVVVLLFFVGAVRGDDGDGCGWSDAAEHDRAKAVPLKFAAFFSILVAGALWCCLPVLGRRVPALRPESDVFFPIRAFAAGDILATGFIHILSDAFENLTSPCLPAGGPWQDFPFAGFSAMFVAIGTLVVDTVATGYFTRVHMKKDATADGDDEEMQVQMGEVHEGSAHQQMPIR